MLPRELIELISLYLSPRDLFLLIATTRRYYQTLTTKSYLSYRTQTYDPLLDREDYLRALSYLSRYNYRYHAEEITPINDLSELYQRHVVRWGWEEYYTDAFGRIYEYNGLPYPHHRLAQDIRLIISRTSTSCREPLITLDYTGTISVASRAYPLRAQKILATNFESIVYLDDADQVYRLDLEGKIERLFDAQSWRQLLIWYQYKVSNLTEGVYRLMYYIAEDDLLYSVRCTGIHEITTEPTFTRDKVRKMVYYGSWQFCYLSTLGELIAYDNGFQGREGYMVIMNEVIDAVSDGANLFILRRGQVYRTHTLKWPTPQLLISDIPYSCRFIHTIHQNIGVELIQIW